jgi:hypothetical protein
MLGSETLTITMQRTLARIFIILFGYLAICTPSLAGEPTNNWKSCFENGGCIGEVKMTVTRAFWDDAVGTFVISSFSNGEYYFEDLSSTPPRKILHLPDSAYLFYGVNGTKEAESLRDTYQHRAGRVMFLVLILVASGFPEGANAIPDAWESRKVDLQGEGFQVSAQKVATDAFLFRTQGPNWHVEGKWVMTKTSPWPDNQSMNGWTTWDGKTIPTVGEARRFARR